MARFVGIDLGAESLQVVEIEAGPGAAGLRWTRRRACDHDKAPGPALLAALRGFDWDGVAGAAVTGRFARLVDLPRIPARQARAAAQDFLAGSAPATIVSIGARGFAVLELRASGRHVLRENARCSQGTGNFLRQLAGRFDLSVAEAAALAEGVGDAALLSGRCPVILKTDLTHLANKGERRARIIAGLFDALAENVAVLLRPGHSPSPLRLTGGVSRAPRVRAYFARWAARHGLQLAPYDEDEALFFDALGAAVLAARGAGAVRGLDALLAPVVARPLERTGALTEWLGRVHRMARPPASDRVPGPLFLGLDIGSTGSKAVALDIDAREPCWEAYTRTNGDPVGAAQVLLRRFLDDPLGSAPVLAFAVTGSGREIVGSLLASCYGPDAVFVLNEIAAHAAGAVACDPRVDTIFEIGGQDAKYIRLAGGRVVDAAMNEACSAGTGSFIEEQGRHFAGIRDVVELGHAALAAPFGVSLGRHCSVFMAEVIDEAIAAGAPQGAVIAGIYDAVVRNYLERVKGNRPVGEVVFCQGMPFAAPALAAAVARQTGRRIVVPPAPGTVGAHGIALLALRALDPFALLPLDPALFLAARVEAKETFVCRSTHGCGGAGNRCRIDRLDTVVSGATRRFTWGGACSLHDRALRRAKLPDRAPDPFREREELVAELVRGGPTGDGPVIALTDEFALKGLFPFFVTFFRALGFRATVHRGADRGDLKRGIEAANVPFCAPMQQYHGIVGAMAAAAPDLLFLPMLRGLPRTDSECLGAVCPVAQGSADILRADLGAGLRSRIVSPVIDVGPGNLDSPEFERSCRRLAAELGASRAWRRAWQAGRRVQEGFDAACLLLGRNALHFAAEHAVTPVVVLGRPYTIYNDVLNSNVPALLREQGVLPIPIDCLPLDERVPAVDDVYWAHGQRIVRAAAQVRRTPGMYAVFCSNYACGPDSFNLHFVAETMSGKPFAIIETDGHAGDAGTKTRLEAFLHCVREHLCGEQGAAAWSLADVARRDARLPALRSGERTVLIPWPDDVAEAVAAALRGLGVRAETLGEQGPDDLREGQRHTSGKECLPLALTLGAVLRRVRGAPGRFTVLMPRSTGPCRFGVYHLLHKMTLDRLGLADRVDVWAPSDDDWFAGTSRGFAGVVLAGIASIDLLRAAYLEVRGDERTSGAALARYREARPRVFAAVEAAARVQPGLPALVAEIASGALWGCGPILRAAGAEFAALRGTARPRPRVLLTGEIYVRCDDFANGYVIDRLEERGLAVRVAEPVEWMEYVAWCNRGRGLADELLYRFERAILGRLHGAIAPALGWPARQTVEQVLAAGADYLRPELLGEAVLTLGGALSAWRRHEIDGVVSVGPMECMPTKLAETQFAHVSENEGLVTLTLPLSGEPLDEDLLDAFAYEVHASAHRTMGACAR